MTADSSLGRTLLRWREQIAAWHQAHVSNGPTEAANNLIKRVKRVAFGLTRFRNFRIRVLLYAGRPNWDLLATVTPAEIRRAGFRSLRLIVRPPGSGAESVEVRRLRLLAIREEGASLGGEPRNASGLKVVQ